MNNEKIIDRVNDCINIFRKEGNKVLLSVAQLLKSKLETNLTAPSNQQKQELDIVKSFIKQMNDEIETFAKGNRPDKVLELDLQKIWLNNFIPTLYTRDEIWATITNHFDVYDMIPINIGEIIKVVKSKMDNDRLDGKLLSELAKEYLNR
jgi:uncharacterized protein YqeY